jgi:hypothetical protein
MEIAGDCPNPAQVKAALDYILKGASAMASASDAAVLSVADLGPAYRVSLADQTREQPDPKRDCDERARVAAVFAAITMEPPEIAARARPALPSPAPRRIELRAVGLAEYGGGALALGGELRSGLVGARWGLELGAGFLPGIDFDFGGYPARMTRFPLDLGVVMTLRKGPVAAGLSAGPAVAVFNLRGEGTGLPVHESGTRVDVGFRSAVFIALFPAARVSPVLDVRLSLWPSPYHVIVEPLGRVGTTPTVWVGATLGFAVTL